VGLVKFDFLGLTTLTIIEEAVDFIRDIPGQQDFNLAAVPLDDRQAYDIFARGSTTAIFQFESRGMRDLIMQAKPSSVEDLTALNALYRPGPMELIPDYIKRKTGQEKVTYLDPRVEPLLKPTLGIMVYQEQVMQIAQVVGGYSLGGADLLRRAMGKKKPEEMAKHRGIFGEGAEKNGVSRAVADELFDFMEKFAGYGFNKSHSAAYSLVAFHTAYLKAHFPAAFMAANMSCIMDFTDKVQQIADDARVIGLTLQAPDINAGTYRFFPLDHLTIRYGLGAVKGTGRSAIEAIVAAREADGPFVNLLDFVKRVDRSRVNRRAMEALIRAGAFDMLEANRAALLATLPQAVELAEKALRDAQQVNLFGDATPESGGVLALAAMPMWSERERLNNEKLSLGFYLSGHPFTTYAREIRQFAKTLLADLQPKNESILMSGILYEQRVRNGKRGRMCVMTLDDGSARAEVVAYNDVFDKRRHLIRDDQPLIVRGRVSYDDFSGGNRVVADDVISIDEARKFARLITLQMNGDADSARLRRLLTPHVAPHETDAAQVRIHYNNGDAELPVTLPDQWRVRVSEPLVDALTEWLTADGIIISYDATNMMPAPPPRGWRDQYQSQSQFSGAGEY
jgi:DNA polymerase III subunit alpha